MIASYKKIGFLLPLISKAGSTNTIIHCPQSIQAINARLAYRLIEIIKKRLTKLSVDLLACFAVSRHLIVSRERQTEFNKENEKERFSQTGLLR